MSLVQSIYMLLSHPQRAVDKKHPLYIKVRFEAVPEIGIKQWKSDQCIPGFNQLGGRCVVLRDHDHCSSKLQLTVRGTNL